MSSYPGFAGSAVISDPARAAAGNCREGCHHACNGMVWKAR